jgi:excinuclease ABC subunit C
MVELAIPEDPVEFDRALEELPNRQAVFLSGPREGKPYLARTNVLRKRLKRVLGNLRGAVLAGRISVLRARGWQRSFWCWNWRGNISARVSQRHPAAPAALREADSFEPFPRTQVTTHIGRARAVYFGPFRNRSTAARFESEFLDLFQLRRCQEDLDPSPDHPGCIYGEMGRCLRPCQQAVGVEEYRGEAERVCGVSEDRAAGR